MATKIVEYYSTICRPMHFHLTSQGAPVVGGPSVLLLPPPHAAHLGRVLQAKALLLLLLLL